MQAIEVAQVSPGLLKLCQSQFDFGGCVQRLLKLCRLLKQGIQLDLNVLKPGLHVGDRLGLLLLVLLPLGLSALIRFAGGREVFFLSLKCLEVSITSGDRVCLLQAGFQLLLLLLSRHQIALKSLAILGEGALLLLLPGVLLVPDLTLLLDLLKLL